MARLEELRLQVKVARLYYEAGVRQPEIAERLHLSQATVSRLLRRAEQEGIVRITVGAPTGVYPELEEGLQARFGLQEAIVVACEADDELEIIRDLGGAAAFYVESTVRSGDVVGVASYASLLAMVNGLRPPPAVVGGAGVKSIRVVQLTGGVGNPAAAAHATQLTRRLADRLRGEAVLLPAPGLTASPEARRLFLQDPFVQQAMATFDESTVALVGIASTARRSAAGFMSAFTDEERRSLEQHGAVGFICHRFFDAHGAPVETVLDERIVAATRMQLRRVPRTVGISGGRQRLPAIRAALEGGWITVLITDQSTAASLLEQRPK